MKVTINSNAPATKEKPACCLCGKPAVCYIERGFWYSTKEEPYWYYCAECRDELTIK